MMTPLPCQSRELRELEDILARSGGGVHKLIDRNRELLELLVQGAPDFMLHNAQLLTWFREQDAFLSQLADSSLAPRHNRNSSPRPFPAPHQRERVRPLRSVASRSTRRSR